MKKQTSCLVVCSGGMDSTTALYHAIKKFDRVEAISFDYGSNHNKREIKQMSGICADLKIKHTIVKLPLGKILKSSLLEGSAAIPEGHYAAENMKSTVVPFRNGIMLAVAAGVAESNGLSKIMLGNHGGDHFIYPDCRPEFIESMNAAIKAGTAAKITIVSPFCNKTKADIVKIGTKLGVPFDRTYSCYKGGKKHCGKCGTCVERKEAFALAKVKDPTDYEA